MRRTIFALSFLAGIGVATTVAADCGKVPENPVWGRIANGAITAYVDEALGGDWQTYLDTWERRLKSVQGMRERGSTMILHDRGLRLNGDRLSAYVADIESRLTVLRCLADLQDKTGDASQAIAGSVLREGS